MYTKELDKAFFEHYMAYGTVHLKSFLKEQLQLLVIQSVTVINTDFYQKSTNTRDNITHTVTGSFSENQLLSNKLHKPKTRKIKKREIHSGC